MVARVQDAVRDPLSRQLAALVRCSRGRFHEIHDSLMLELRAADVVGAFKLEPFLSVVLGEDFRPATDDVEAFTRAFASAERGHWLKPLVARCLELSGIDSAALNLMQPQSGDQRTVLQAALDLAEGFSDPILCVSGLLRTVPRICLVSARVGPGNESQGTGFLVGPQAVLTAWHVIEPLLDCATGRPQVGSERMLSVDFDFIEPLDGSSPRRRVKSYGVVEDWLLEHSPCHPSEKSLRTGGLPDSLDGKAIHNDRLDFAVIRLNGSPGRDRGYVRLRPASIQLRAGEQLKLYLFQHSNQFPQRFATGRLTGFFGNDEPPPRFRHGANSGAGSSGGLCLDATFESVGLHQASILDTSGKPIANQAIPTAAIAKQLERAFQVDVTVDPLWQLKETDTPVIGREDFQRAVWKLVRGESRVICVRGPRRSGLSYSKRILKAMLPENDAVIVEISAQEMGRDPEALANRLVASCGGVPDPNEGFPPSTTAATTPEAWLRDQLAPALLERLDCILAGRQLWIVLEHLDRHDVPQGQAYDLLLTLMTSQAGFPPRFLLLGPREDPPGVPLKLIEEDRTEWPQSRDVELYIQRRCAAHNITMMRDEQRSLARMVVHEATRVAPNNPWQEAIAFLIRNIHPRCDVEG